MTYNKLLYGKEKTERIVSIEAHDNTLELFIQELDGSITSKFVPNKFWLLSNKKQGNKWTKLDGNLHYSWGTQFDSRKDFQKARNYYKRQDIYSVYDPKESSMINSGYTYFKGMKREEVSVLSFDIETTGINPLAIDAKVLLIANTFRDSHGNVTRRMFTYDENQNMFDTWSSWVREINPSIILGHNIFSFDLPYIAQRASRSGERLDLGRDGSSCYFESKESKFRKDGSQFYHYKKARVFGREIVDTLFLSINHDRTERKYESYALKQIIAQEGLEQKNRVFYDAATIKDNYMNPIEWEKIKKYAETDADDALSLYDLMSPPFFYMTQMIPKSYQEVNCSATGSQINSMMVRSYLQDKHSIPKADDAYHFAGATVYGNPGIYKNCIRWDVASLYPSIMRQYKVYDKDKDPKAYFLELVETLTVLRLKYKELGKTDKYSNYMQLAFKTLINSMYGFLGAPGLNFNCIPAAEFVTATGRAILGKGIEWATGVQHVE